jgi:hypothetical protein
LRHEGLALVEDRNGGGLRSLAAVTGYIAIVDYLFEDVLRNRGVVPV